MAETIAIPQDLLNEFSSGVNGTGETPAPGIPLASADKALAWIVAYADKTAKKNSLPGIEDMEPKELAELIRICLVDLKQEKILEKSPLLMLGTVGTGILVQNYLAWVQNQKKELGSAGEQPKKGEEEPGS